MKIVNNSTVDLISVCGDDLSVVNAARVSFDKFKNNFDEKDEKLINYLAKHEHNSPFNHAFLSFRIHIPLFVARQLVKHKFLPWNEVSRRYVDSEPEFYLPVNWRKKAANKKQGSDETKTVGIYWPTKLTNDALEGYQDLLSDGVCPEQARMILPQNMMTTVIWSGTLGAWLNMLRLRLKNDTQLETREVAKKIGYYVYKHFQCSFNAYIDADKELIFNYLNKMAKE